MQNRLPEIITKTSDLEKLCHKISNSNRVAIDLEMDSLHHYHEKISLIQISTGSDSFIIDPLTDINLEAFGAVLKNEHIEKIMHGADYDIRLLYKNFGFEVKNLFDTMIAARFLGIREFGLAALIESRFGVILDKKLQKCDWSRRPLTEEMRLYAIADTFHLIPLAKAFAEEMVSKTLFNAFKEDCDILTNVRMAEKSGALYQYCKGASKLKPRSLTALEALLRMRESYAAKIDKPCFKVISSETLIKIAEIMPKCVADLSEIKGFTPNVAKKFGDEIICIIRKIARLPSNELIYLQKQQKPKESEGYKERLNKLKKWRQSFAEKTGLEEGFIAPNRLLEAFADKGDEASKCMKSWQRELFGDEIVNVLKENPGR